MAHCHVAPEMRMEKSLIYMIVSWFAGTPTYRLAWLK